MDDDQIVELYLKRNENAIAETAKKYGMKLRDIAYRILNDKETAEECEYDAYYKAWNLIPLHEPRNYLFAFVGKIVRHLALDICRKNNRQKRYALYCELTQEMEECIPAQNDTEAEIEARLLSSLIDSFLEHCPEERRNVFVRRYWYFEPVAQIAKTCGFTESKVKAMLSRMRAETEGERDVPAEFLDPGFGADAPEAEDQDAGIEDQDAAADGYAEARIYAPELLDLQNRISADMGSDRTLYFVTASMILENPDRLYVIVNTQDDELIKLLKSYNSENVLLEIEYSDAEGVEE